MIRGLVKNNKALLILAIVGGALMGIAQADIPQLDAFDGALEWVAFALGVGAQRTRGAV